MAYTLLSKGYLAYETEVLQIYAHLLPIRIGSIYKTGLFCGTDTDCWKNFKMQPTV